MGEREGKRRSDGQSDRKTLYYTPSLWWCCLRTSMSINLMQLKANCFELKWERKREWMNNGLVVGAMHKFTNAISNFKSAIYHLSQKSIITYLTIAIYLELLLKKGLDFNLHCLITSNLSKAEVSLITWR